MASELSPLVALRLGRPTPRPGHPPPCQEPTPLTTGQPVSSVLAEVFGAVEFDQAFEHGDVATELVASFGIGHERGRWANLSLDLTMFDLDLKLPYTP